LAILLLDDPIKPIQDGLRFSDRIMDIKFIGSTYPKASRDYSVTYRETDSLLIMNRGASRTVDVVDYQAFFNFSVLRHNPIRDTFQTVLNGENGTNYYTAQLFPQKVQVSTKANQV
jgi:hypothetical protein